MPHHSRQALLFATVVLLWAPGLWAQDQPRQAPKSETVQTQSRPAASHPGFERLKKLAGEWVPAETAEPTTQPTGDREGAGPSDTSQPICIYKVVSAGSVVQETLFPGTPHEMVTMYYQEGPDLILTHYCAMGNQPRMRAEPPTDASKLEFKFAGGSNINPGKDMHMHDLTLTFVDADRVRAEWTLYRDGQQSGVKTFDLKRKK
jgi:hypothetical protein